MSIKTGRAYGAMLKLFKIYLRYASMVLKKPCKGVRLVA